MSAPRPPPTGKLAPCGQATLDHLRSMNFGTVDMIYLDTPLNSNRNYATLTGFESDRRAFKDTGTLSD